MNNDPKEAVLKYLNKNGFPFEMFVAREFRRFGFEVSQSIIYSDPNTEKSRELDILAVSEKQGEANNFRLVFVIECKVAPTPWIILQSSTDNQDFKGGYCFNQMGAPWIKHLYESLSFKNLFDNDYNPGYGVLTVSNKDVKDEKDDAGNSTSNSYKATQTLVGYLKSVEKVNSSKYSYLTSVSRTIYVPLIAIDGLLFAGWLRQDGEMDCKQISEGQLYSTESIGGVSPKIHIVTRAGLADFIQYVASRIYDDIFSERSIKGFDSPATMDAPTVISRNNRFTL